MEYSLDQLAAEIDAASTSDKEADLERLLGVCDDQLLGSIGTDRVDLNYFMANIHSALHHIQLRGGARSQWDAPEVVKEILALRKAIAESDFENSYIVRQCQIRTNLGNSLLKLGRSVEAVEEFTKAIGAISKFAMALGGRAIALTQYSRYLYNIDNQIDLLHLAARDLTCALDQGAFWESDSYQAAEAAFSTRLSEINAFMQHQDVNDNSIAASEIAKPNSPDYKEWILAHRLFLNPLNDGSFGELAENDTLHLPPHSYSVDEEILFPALYNALKQEYVSARYLLFKSQDTDDLHFSDSCVSLFDSFDNGHFGFRTQQLVASFRMAYSIFDKISVFINEYFKVGLETKSTSFRNIWVQQVKGNGGAFTLRPAFQDSQNGPLSGLYFLSKDFFDDRFKEVASPEAKDFSDLRNYAEHKFLTLTDSGLDQTVGDFHRKTTQREFKYKSLRLLKMSRAALIYLSMAIQHEEEERERKGIKPQHSFTVNAIPIDRTRFSG